MQSSNFENKNTVQPLMVSRSNVPKYFVGLSPKTLANWKSLGKGPRCYNVGGRCAFYRLDELQDYLEGKRHASQSK